MMKNSILKIFGSVDVKITTSVLKSSCPLKFHNFNSRKKKERSSECARFETCDTFFNSCSLESKKLNRKIIAMCTKLFYKSNYHPINNIEHSFTYYKLTQEKIVL